MLRHPSTLYFDMGWGGMAVSQFTLPETLHFEKKYTLWLRSKLPNMSTVPHHFVITTMSDTIPNILIVALFFTAFTATSVTILSIVYQISVSLNIHFSKGGLTQNDQILCPTLMCMIFVFATDCSRNWSCHQANEPHP